MAYLSTKPLFFLSLAVSAWAVGTPLPASGIEAGQFHLAGNSQSDAGCLAATGKYTSSSSCDTFTVEGLGNAPAAGWNKVEIRNSRNEKCAIGIDNGLQLTCSPSVSRTTWVYRPAINPEMLVTNFQMASYRSVGNEVPSGSNEVGLIQDGRIDAGPTYYIYWVKQ